MNVSPAKENILKKIRKALTQTTPLPFPASEGNQSVYHAAQQEPEVEFAENFTSLLGKFIYCSDAAELREQFQSIAIHKGWKRIYSADAELTGTATTIDGITITDDIEVADAAITGCEALIARTGSILLSSAMPGGRTISVYAPVHICIAYEGQIVYDIRDGLNLMREKYGENIPSLISFATGPSRTADIEKTLVVGVHGPKEVYVFYVER
jgi:L-lactate dehydrogenase complex protein LldG